MAALFLLITWLLFSVSYETNDDSAMMYTIAGYRTGQIEVNSVFSSIVWGGIVGGAYRLLPQLPWYTIFSILVIWLSHAIILRSVFQNAEKRRDLFLFMVVYMGAAIYSTAFLQFTTTALWAGIAACSMGMCLFEKNSRKSEIVILISLMMISFCIRKLVGIVALFFLGIVFCVNSMKHRDKGTIKKYIFVLVIVVLTMVLERGINSIYENKEGWTEWREYNQERVKYKDYTAVSYEENPEVYEKVGWDKNLYDLVDSWFFLDSHVNKESFQVLNEYKRLFEKEKNGEAKLYEAVYNITNMLRDSPIAFIMFCQMGIVAIAIWLKSIVCRDKILAFQVLLIVFCSVLMVVYLGVKERVPLRVFQVCVLPATVLLGIIFVKEQENNKLKNWGGTEFVIILVLLICISGVARYTYKQSLNIIYNEGIEIRMDMENYAVKHPENLYIYDYSLSFIGDPFAVYPSGKPVNYMFWGGSTMFSPIYNRQLEVNGRTELYSEAFLEEHVYFVSREDIGKDTLLVKYMCDRFQGMDYKKVDDVNGCGIYKFYYIDDGKG